MATNNLGTPDVGTSQGESLEADLDQYFKKLIEASSLGTPAASRVRASSPRDTVENVRRRLKKAVEEERQAARPEAGGAWTERHAPARPPCHPRRVGLHRADAQEVAFGYLESRYLAVGFDTEEHFWQDHQAHGNYDSPVIVLWSRVGTGKTATMAALMQAICEPWRALAGQAELRLCYVYGARSAASTWRRLFIPPTPDLGGISSWQNGWNRFDLCLRRDSARELLELAHSDTADYPDPVGNLAARLPGSITRCTAEDRACRAYAGLPLQEFRDTNGELDLSLPYGEFHLDDGTIPEELAGVLAGQKVVPETAACTREVRLQVLSMLVASKFLRRLHVLDSRTPLHGAWHSGDGLARWHGNLRYEAVQSANVLLTVDGLRIIDSGIAYADATSLVVSGPLLEIPVYMPSEPAEPFAANHQDPWRQHRNDPLQCVPRLVDPVPEADVFLPAEDQARPIRVLRVADNHYAHVLDHNAGATAVAREPEPLPHGIARRTDVPILIQRSDLLAEARCTPDRLLRILAHLQVYRRNRIPARYQPITLLWAFSRARRGEQRLVSWPETQREIKGLLSNYGREWEGDRVFYPVAALYKAGLWELDADSAQVPSAHGSSVPRRWFEEHKPKGGLALPIRDLLRESPDTLKAAVNVLVENYFIDADPVMLLSELGLTEPEPEAISPLEMSFVARAASYQRLCERADVFYRDRATNRARRTSTAWIRSQDAREAVLLRSEGHCENPECTGDIKDRTDTGAPILEIDQSTTWPSAVTTTRHR